MIDKIMEFIENLLISTQNGWETLLEPIGNDIVKSIFGDINPLMLLSFTTLEILFIYYLVRGLII